MDNSKIYEDIMLVSGMIRIKSNRDTWPLEEGNTHPFLSPAIDIGGKDYGNYEFIMNSCNSVIRDMIPALISALLQAYNYPVEWHLMTKTDAYLYTVDQAPTQSAYLERAKNKNSVYAFSCNDKEHKGMLYIFKEIGLNGYIPISFIDSVLKDNNLTQYCYISLVWEDAFLEQINHNDDKGDPSRGTGLYSLKQLFDSFFTEEEYCVFKSYAEQFTKDAQDYLGFEVVRTLSPNALYNFKQIVKDELSNYNLEDGGIISEDQKAILDSQFHDQKRYELIVSKNDFSQSYITSEWLRKSLRNATNIDLTSIAMGYLKSIEQFLFRFICLHTKEKDGSSRKIYVKGSLLELTNSLIENEEITKDITLGSLIGFFGYYDKADNSYHLRNKDLLVGSIKATTHEYIISALSKISELRNEYFHKRNLSENEIIEEARKNAQLTFYLILGAYKLSEKEMQDLGWNDESKKDAYYKLCQYMNTRHIETPLNIPIFYYDKNADPYHFMFVHEDPFIKYDAYDYPVYSGIYLYFLGEEQHLSKLTRENLPAEIWEGVLITSLGDSFEIKPSGPVKKIYSAGKFWG